jgi:site-specific recombinase XerD
MCPSDPWAAVRAFREVDKPKVHYLLDDELTRLMNACPRDFRELVMAALLTGCRYGELTAMRVGDLDPQARTITITRGKGGSARHVVLTEEGLTLFVRQAAGKHGSALMFERDLMVKQATRDREAQTQRGAWGKSHQFRMLRCACAVAKIVPAISFHILRHTYASRLVMRGAPMPVIAAQLGHTDTRMTERHYAHLGPSYVAATVRQTFGTLGIMAAGDGVSSFPRSAASVDRSSPYPEALPGGIAPLVDDAENNEPDPPPPEFYQRARQFEDRRHQWLRLFVRAQRKIRAWIWFRDIANWRSRTVEGVDPSRGTQSTLPNEAQRKETYRLLMVSLLLGDFQHGGRTRVHLLNPLYSFRRLTLEDAERFASWHPNDLAGLTDECLQFCVIPREVARLWFQAQAWVPPPWLRESILSTHDSPPTQREIEGPNSPPALALPEYRVIEPALPLPRNRAVGDLHPRGPRPEKRNDITKRMMADYDPAALASEKQTVLADKYGAARSTVARARKAALDSEWANPSTNSDKP